MNNEMIKCENVSYSYNGKAALIDVSFTLCEGDYLCILGENGSGKSTLAKLILNLVKPDSGKISYIGLKNTEIGNLPQTSYIEPDFPASVYEVVLQGRCNKLGKGFFYSSADKKDAEEKMALLGLTKLKNKNFTSLSGGQKQRVLLARALCTTEKLLILDEPVSGLDPIVTAEMYDIIEKLNKEKGISVVMISHDTKTVAKYANKILHLNKKVEFFGETSEYEKTELYHHFLGGCGHEHH